MAAVKTAAGTDYSQIPLERLEHEISTLAAHIYAATCRWLLMIAEFDRREGWATWGMTSCVEWLAFKCSLSPRSARDHVRVAKALEELPHIRDAFAAGELSYSKVRALTRIATPETDEDLAGVALHITAAQLDKLVRAYGRATEEEQLELAQRRHRERQVTWTYDEYGMLILNARLDPEEGMLVVKALESSIAAAKDGGSAEPSNDEKEEKQETSDAPTERPAVIHRIEEDSYLQRAADGLVMMAETYLETGPRARKGGDRFRVLVHVDYEALMAVPRNQDDGCDCAHPKHDDAVPRNRIYLDDGPALARATLDRIMCDSSILASLERSGKPLDIGRETRSISPRLRRALELRDGGCIFPGCERKGFVDAHHIVRYPDGKTKLSNLVLLCRSHHRAVHEGGYSIRKEEDRLVFVRPDGIPLPAVHFMRAAGPGLESRNAEAGMSADHETCMTQSFESVDYPDLVFALKSTERLRPHPN